MTSGRKPLPTALKLIKNNSAKRPINKREAQVPLSQPVPPDFLTPDAKAEWIRVVATLNKAGLMTDLDCGALAAYAGAYGRWALAERTLLEMAKQDKVFHGLMVKTTHGNIIQNPLIGTANRARHDMVRFSIEFGMTPSSRSQVSVNTASGKANRFLNIVHAKNENSA